MSTLQSFHFPQHGGFNEVRYRTISLLLVYCQEGGAYLVGFLLGKVPNRSSFGGWRASQTTYQTKRLSDADSGQGVQLRIDRLIPGGYSGITNERHVPIVRKRGC